MAFALTKFRAYPLQLSSPNNTRAVQCAILTISATASDVDLDIGDDNGDFWGNALANTKYGGLAREAQRTLKSITGRCDGLLYVGSPQLLSRVKAAVANDSDYELTVQNHLPNITCDTGKGESSWLIMLQWQLKDFEPGVNENYG